MRARSLFLLPSGAIVLHYLLTSRGPLSMHAIRKALGKSAPSIFRAMVILRKARMLSHDEQAHTYSVR